MENVFLGYIKQGRIRNLDELKRTYRRIVMKTHPDAVGSDSMVEEYLACRQHYEEARALLENTAEPPPIRDERLLFYREFYRLERMDKPWAFNRYYFSRQEIELGRQRASEYFSQWQPEREDLYRQANREYDLIKREKPLGPYRKQALLFNLSSVFHNILSYQLTGLQFYRRQLRQNLAVVLFQLEQRKFRELVEFVQFLIADMERGPVIRAVHGE